MAEFRALGLGQAESPAHPAGPAATLVLEASPAGPRAGRPVRPGRHRGRPGRRRAPRRSSDRPGLLLGTATAAAIVLALVVAGSFVGPFKGITSSVARSVGGKPSAAHSTGNSAAPRVETTSAAREPTAHPPAAPAQPTGSEVCRAYYTEYQHPGASAWAAELSLWHQLTELVGSEDPFQVLRYCAPYVRDLLPGGVPVIGQNPLPVHGGLGDQGNGHQGQQGNGLGGGKDGSGGGQVGGSQRNAHGSGLGGGF